MRKGRSARADKVDVQPKGQGALAVEGSSESPQPSLRYTRRITRSTCKPGDLLDPGGPGSFIRKTSGKQQTAPRSSTASSGQGLLAAASAESERSSTQSFFQPKHVYDTIEFGESSELSEEDFVEAFYRKVGYLVPLDDATLEAFEQFLNMSAEAATGRISSGNRHKFEAGLDWRNVSLKTEPDPKLEELHKLRSRTSPQYPPQEREAREVLKRYHDQLWDQDRKKCEDHSQEAIFQRTLLISMIDRLNLIYGTGKASGSGLFDFAVETPWECAPMPTKAAEWQEAENAKWLTRPRPDLAVAFVRETLFPEDFKWNNIPPATQRLICYEGNSPGQYTRAFHFLTIEAKRAYTGIDDCTARNQGLNSASQALHNMYEFFKEADTETKLEKREENHYTNMFFDKIRVFSVVATDGGMKIRIHRACDRNHHKKPMEAITDDYPLQFAYDDYAEINRKEFKYQRVVEELSNIILGYGAGELKDSLQSAIRAVNNKFTAYREDQNKPLARDEHYYSHGQVPPSTKRKTFSVSVATTGEYASESSRARTARPSKDSGRRSTSMHLSQLGMQSQGSQTDPFPLPPATASPSPSSETSQQQGNDRGNKRRRV